jgi:signal transduction histidine kinase
MDLLERHQMADEILAHGQYLAQHGGSLDGEGLAKRRARFRSRHKLAYLFIHVSPPGVRLAAMVSDTLVEADFYGKGRAMLSPLMESADPRSRRNYARRDAAVVIAATLLAALVCARLNVGEAVARWTRPYERLQLDELPLILLVMAIGLIWFSSRRYFEAKRQLELRGAADAKLAETLTENQRLALKYVDMQEHERKALARDLHDELGQFVNAMKLDAVSIRDAAADRPTIRDTACAVIANVDRVYEVLRGLIRQLRPVGFDELGLVAALENCVNEWRSRLPAAQIEMVCGPELDALAESRALVLFRLVQEALTNVARHSSATRVKIQIGRAVSAPGIDISIADNGCGADHRARSSGLGERGRGLGLIGMRERVAALGGSIAVSNASGAPGFEVRAFLPLQDLHGHD